MALRLERRASEPKAEERQAQLLAALAVPLHPVLEIPSIPVGMVAMERVSRLRERAAEERPDHLEREVAAAITLPSRTLAAAVVAVPTAEHRAATVQALLVVPEVALGAGPAEADLAAPAARAVLARYGRRHRTVPRRGQAVAAAAVLVMMAVALVALVGPAVHMAAAAVGAVSG